MSDIVAQITGSNRCDAEGLTVTGQAPVLGMCRKLLEAGFDPTRPLKAYRGDMLWDKPLHGEIKLAGMADEFYRQRVGQHLEIGLKALEKLKAQEWERLHSRKLRSFAEVAFQ